MRRHSSNQRDEANTPRDVTIEQQPRRSTRLRLQENLRIQDEDPSKDRRPHQVAPRLKPIKTRSALLTSRKRLREDHHVAAQSSRKRFRRCPAQAAEPEASSGISTSQRSNILHWVTEKTWPRETLELGFFQLDNMYLLARKKSSIVRRKRSESNLSATSDEQGSSDIKPVVYTHRSYPTWLKTQGVYMERSELGISDDSKMLCQSLLESKCDTPQNSLFRDDIFEEVIDDLQDKNESRIIQDIARLLVPSVKTVARVHKLKHLKVLVESVNEGWDNCIPLIDPRPQPDYAVGIGRSGLGENRISKLRLLLGENPSYQSPLMATHYMYFPILTSEVKCGTTGLEIADRQNAHSMGLAVRAIVLIFQLAKKESELHRKIVAFSVSNDHQSVRLHGWYVIIDGEKFTIHRHLIHAFDITARGGHERWTAYKFSRGVYEHAIMLLERIYIIIDELPANLNLGNQLPGLQGSEYSGLSQQFEEQLLSEPIAGQQITPEASAQDLPGSKRKKQKHRGLR